MNNFMPKKSIFISLALMFMCVSLNAQKVVKLWDGNPPSENGITAAENHGPNLEWITNVSSAEIAIYLPEKSKNTGMAVLICPGGGYGGLAYDHEGIQFVEWLNSKGIAGIILKYRMPNKHKEIPLDDAQQAMRYIRDNAKELNINVNKVGIAGFSAGGHLASTVSTHYATKGTSTRPDFSLLFYPVVTMTMSTHGGSRTNLLGDNPEASDIHMFSNEKQINSNTPPAILLLSDDDKVVLPINSIEYYNALKNNNIPASMYIFPEGGHGWGLKKDFKYYEQMTSLLEMWLKDIDSKL